MVDKFANASETTLSAGIDADDTTLSLISALPGLGGTPFRVRVRDDANPPTRVEIMKVTAGAGTTSLTVERAAESYAGVQTGVAFQAGDIVENVFTAGALTDLVGTMGSGVGVRVRAVADVGLTSGALTYITWDTEDYDPDGFHSTSSNTSRLTVPPGLGGKYFISGSAFMSTGIGAGYNALRKNGTTLVSTGIQVENTSASQATINTVLDLADGDFIEWGIRVPTTSKSVVDAGVADPSFTMMRLNTSIEAPGRLLGYASHAAGADAALLTTSSTTFVDVDATNLAVTFVVPPSGSVIVRESALVNSGGDALFFGIREGTTPLAQETYISNINAAMRGVGQILVTGLTPGATKTWKMAARKLTAVAGNIYSGPTFGQVMIEIFDTTTDAGPAAQAFQATLGSNVSIASGATWYDVVSLALNPGNYVVDWKALCEGGGIRSFYGQLIDSTNTTEYDYSEVTVGTTGGYRQMLNSTTRLSLTTTTTIKIRIRSDAGSNNVVTNGGSGTGGNATKIVALKVA